MIILSAIMLPFMSTTQNKQLPAIAKAISTELFGIFFEDISYAADGAK